MRRTFQVVDDFYADPYRVRQLAITKGRWSDPKTDVGTTYDCETFNSFYSPDIARAFERLIRQPIVYDPARMGFGVFSLTGEDAHVNLTTHFDDTDWAGIVFLVPPESCSGGLSFYRHRKTGFTGPPSDAEAHAIGYTSRDQWVNEVYYPDKLQEDAWEEITHVGMRFNRLVLMRGTENFHRASSGFGHTPSNGRLTQRFFFNDAAEVADA